MWPVLHHVTVKQLSGTLKNTAKRDL